MSASTIESQRLGSQTPTLLREPDGAVDWTFSDIAIEAAREYDYVLDEWQEWLVRWAFARRADGLWAARDLGIEVTRQSGKNIVLEVIEICAVFHFDERLVIHSAHRSDVSHEHFLSLREHIRECPDLMDAMPTRPNRGFITQNGNESIELANGARILFKSRQSGSGRGPRPQRLVFDEALVLDPNTIGDMAPALSAQPNPQVIFASSSPKANSDMLHSLRRRAINPAPDDRFMYAAWNNPPDTDVADRDAWYRVNPSLGHGRMTEESLMANRRLMSPEDFMREHLGIPEDPIDESAGPIPLERWLDLVDGESLPLDPTLRLALDVMPDRTSATFAIAGRRSDNLAHVSVRYTVTAAEMTQLVELAKGLCEQHNVSLILPPGSPARGWRGELLEAGVPLDELTHTEYAEACGLIMSKVAEGSIRHRGSPEMLNAVVGLGVRRSYDVDVWSRRNSSANIAPLVAATCALVRVPDTEPLGEWFVDLDEV